LIPFLIGGGVLAAFVSIFSLLGGPWPTRPQLERLQVMIEVLEVRVRDIEQAQIRLEAHLEMHRREHHQILNIIKDLAEKDNGKYDDRTKGRDRPTYRRDDE
jgi:hypothetical protein